MAYAATLLAPIEQDIPSVFSAPFLIPANQNTVSLKQSPYIDMHCHTTRSDGVQTPKELIAEAKSRGLELLCITDHDRSSAEIVPQIRDAGIATVPSIEISTQNSFEDTRSLHMTYYAESISQEIEDIIANTRNKKEEMILAQLQHLEEKGFFVDIEEFYRELESQGRLKSGYSKYDIARYIAAKPENREKLLALGCEDRGKLHMDFYTRCLKRAGDLYSEYAIEVEEYEPEVGDISQIARDRGAILSIAHPNFSFTRDGASGFAELYKTVYRPLGVNAIEINSKATKRWVEVILGLKEKYGNDLQLTFGSDCHRIGKPDDKHGDLGFENRFVSDDLLEREVGDFREKLL